MIDVVANLQGILTGMLILIWITHSIVDHVALGGWKFGKKDNKSTYRIVWVILTITVIINIAEGIILW